VRLLAVKNESCAQFPLQTAADEFPGVILDLDLWVVLPR
jgi:hypothetical protein